MKSILLFSLLFCFQLNLFAQQDAWVYLKDKQNVAAAIGNPISILTQKAIDRKASHNVSIDERDVPVTESYIAQLENATGITVLAKSKWFNCVHVRGTETDINNLISTFSFVDYIDFADNSLNMSRISNSKKQHEVKNKFTLENSFVNFVYGTTQNQIEMIAADDLHLANYTGDGVTIAVIDASFTNVNTMGAFQRLINAGDLLGGYDFVDRTVNIYAHDPRPTSISHGTQVLSTMAGYIVNSYVGTAPDASYYLFRTEDDTSENPVEESYWVEAVERADSLGVDIINTSLGYTTFDNSSYNYSAADLDGNTAFITRGANIAFEKGLLLVTSAGNSGNSGVGAPADSQYVLSVGAVDSSGAYVTFSSVGSSTQPSQKPDVVAQGEAPYLINANNDIVQNSGTSFSSPILAGGIACLVQALQNKTNAEIMQLVRESSTQFNTPDYQLGYGIPNLMAAYNATLSVNYYTNDNIGIYPNPSKEKIFVNFPSNINELSVTIFDVLGKQVHRDRVSQIQNELDISYLQKGVYIVKFNNETISKAIKFIKK